MKQFISCNSALSGLPVMVVLALLLLAQQSLAQPAGPDHAQLISPARIAAIEDGGPLLVTDYNTQSVCMVNRTTLAVLRCFAVEGRPLAVAWAGGRVYVGNETAGSVEVYNLGGKWQFDLGGAKGTVKQPSGMAVDEQSSKAFVVDGAEKDIKVFDLGGGLLYTIGGDLWGEGKLVNPTAVAVDSARGEVLVSDYGDPAGFFPARIKIYDFAGNYIREISGRTGGFSRPQGLSVDDDHVFVTDGVLGQVIVFDRTSGGKLKTLGAFGTNPGQLMLPLDVLVDPSTKDVFVVNNRPGRVELFEEGGLLP